MLPTNSQIVGSRAAFGAESTRLLSGNVLEANQVAIVPDPWRGKFTPVVVNETSALPTVQAAVP
jgi:hypothetical protein